MKITAAQLKARMNTPGQPFIIDVRDEWEYQEENIGALNIPLGNLADRLDELEEYKDSEIVVHCRSGNRARAAQLFLQQNGFINVLNLEGGIVAYMAE